MANRHIGGCSRFAIDSRTPADATQLLAVQLKTGRAEDGVQRRADFGNRQRREAVAGAPPEISLTDRRDANAALWGRAERFAREPVSLLRCIALRLALGDRQNG